MEFWQWLLALYLIAGSLYWLIQLLLVFRVIRSVPALRQTTAPAPDGWPAVSVILPAHNEGDVLEQAVSSRLADDYPNQEIILIDDRSTDATSEIAGALAARDSRVRSLRIDATPCGWWGKTNALRHGLALATGEWVLFSDADVHVAPGTMRKAVAYCEAHGLDHLTVLPEIWPGDFWVDLIFAINVRHIYNNARLWAISDPGSSAAGGLGAFSLIRRQALERAGGIEPLRLEVTEDYAIGKLLKQSGARCGVLGGQGAVGLQWYRTLHGYVVGSDRSTYAYWGKYSLLRITGLVLGMLLFELFPILALVPFGSPWQPGLALGVLAVSMTSSVLINHWIHRPIWPCLLFPAGVALNGFILMRSGIRGKRRGGITWGGLTYPFAVLRASRRL